ncbi:ABC transporter ATP-binding protein [Bacillus thuringiensis]|uniref:ABC transporter ATP-binding protein n=1 Tax=Bacillus thuringiensis TaxID=1428 RepID=UPI00119E40B2|nr:ABC transporter ATP-binding protein [Bacillus thuringiensis]
MKRRKEKIKYSYFQVYKWLLSFLKPYYKGFCIVVLCSIFITSVELSIPKFIQYFVDEIAPNKNLKMFSFIIIIVFILFILNMSISALKTILERKVYTNAAKDLQLALFIHLRNLGFSYFEETPIGRSLTLMNQEVNSAQELYSYHIPRIINSFVFSIFSIVIMFSTNMYLGLIIIPSFLIYYVIGPYFEKKAAVYGEKMATDKNIYNQKLYESITSITEVRAASRENWNIGRMLEKLEIYSRSMIKTYFYQYLKGSIRRGAYYLGAIVLILLGAYLIKENYLTTGEFIAFLLYYFTAMHQITLVVTNIIEQKILIFQVKSIYNFINVKPEVIERKQYNQVLDISGSVKVKNISFKYPGGPTILEDVSFNVEPGQKLAIVGESGNGKSTLLKLLPRFYDPTKGEILVGGIPVQQLSFKQLREVIGFVFQENFLFGLSIKENIRFGNPLATDEEVIEAAKKAAAHDFIIQCPEGYNTFIGERGIKLSGGQKQRIAIARMIIKKPQIILLDEATSSLDTINEREVQKEIFNLLPDVTTITVTHRLATIQDYDEIIVLKNGTIIESGTYNQLLKKSGEFVRLLKGQNESIYSKEEDIHAQC